MKRKKKPVELIEPAGENDRLLDLGAIGAFFVQQDDDFYGMQRWCPSK